MAMRWLVRSIQVCLLLVFMLEVLIPLAGIGALAMRQAYDADLSPSVVTLIQTEFAVAGAVERFFASSLYLALVLLLEVLWIFYLRAINIVSSYDMPVTEDY
jgi:hypothetical protein